MSENKEYYPDKTPVFGLDDLEPTEKPVSELTPQVEEGTEDRARARGETLSVILHDKLSGVDLISDTFPIEIGNGRRFDMALRGPGPDGLYARIERDGDGFVIERCHEGVFMAVDMVETSRFELAGPASIQLGDHLIKVGFTAREPAKRSRKMPAWWLWLSLSLLLVLVMLLMRLLLAADVAESRVTVVRPDVNAGQTVDIDSTSYEASLDTPDVPVVPETTEPEVIEALTIKHDRLLLNPDMCPLSWFVWLVDQPSIYPPVMPMTTSPVELAEVPAQPQVDESSEIRRQNTTPAPAPAVTVAPVSDETYRNALSAVEAFDQAESLDQRLKAWTALITAGQKLDVPQRNELIADREDSVRNQLGHELLTKAQQLRASDNLREAYAYYFAASEFGVTEQAGIQLMTDRDKQAENLFRFGYRLKYSDPSTASLYWRQVLEHVPGQSEWHRKAQLGITQIGEARG